MYKCNHCNITFSDKNDEGILTFRGKMYCKKCEEPVVEIPDKPIIPGAFQGAQATLISNSDNRITTNNYYGGMPDEQVGTPYGTCLKRDTRLCKQCRQWIPLTFYNVERGMCDNCIEHEEMKVFEDGKAFFDIGLYDDALSEFHKLEPVCKNTKVLAELQYHIGLCCYKQKEWKEAFKYFIKTREQVPDSLFYLGLCFYNGLGVSQDFEKALDYFLKAAKLGEAQAQLFLANCLYNGDGVKQNYEEAVKWYLKAAEQGNAEAYKKLGRMYYWGYGVKKDYAEVIKWYRKAAEQGDVQAQIKLGDMYCDGKGVDQDYSEAVKWFKKAAEQGDVQAQTKLGDMYCDGKGVYQDYSEAVKWFKKAAEQGDDGTALIHLGEMYFRGYGVDKNHSEAIKCFMKAGEQGNPKAYHALGEMYYWGHGVNKDYTEAAKWYIKEAEVAERCFDDSEVGYGLTTFRIGEMYYYGKGVKKNLTEATKWYRKSAENGFIHAKIRLEELEDIV